MAFAKMSVPRYSKIFFTSYVSRDQGEVTERPNVAVSKTVGRASVPWVQIPPSPPAYSKTKYGEMLESG